MATGTKVLGVPFHGELFNLGEDMDIEPQIGGISNRSKGPWQLEMDMLLNVFSMLWLWNLGRLHLRNPIPSPRKKGVQLEKER
jgi:hypothetical protein